MNDNEKKIVWISIIWICHLWIPSSGFNLPQSHSNHLKIQHEHVYTKTLLYNQNKSNSEMDSVTKASWFAVEAFGKLFGSKTISKNVTNDDIYDLTKAPSSLKEAMERIQLDNERSYFLSGDVDVYAYDPDCIFSDPFVSFSGTIHMIFVLFGVDIYIFIT